VPRILSSNCSISAKIQYEGNIDDLIDEEIEKIFLTNNNENKLIYEEE
jgi:shikimate kinase